MWIKRIASAVVVAAALAPPGGVSLAQDPKPASPGSAANGKAKLDSAEMTQTEAKLAKLRELIRPQPGEHVTNMAKIAWQRIPWDAAVKAGKEGKPVLIYAEGAAGVACGYG